MNYLTQEQKDEISSLIKEIETKTSAELVAVIVKRSSFFSNFLTKNKKLDLVKKNAMKLFLKLGLNQTKNKLGFMFFVSIKEKQVEIIADEGIINKIPNTTWQKIVDEFIEFVKKDKFAKGYKTAIQQCSYFLIKEFPIQENDENELNNEVIEI